MQRDVDAIRLLLDRALDGLSPLVADERPAPDRFHPTTHSPRGGGPGWSIGDIVEHLARTYMGTARGLGMCLADGRSRATPLSWQGSARKFIVITLGHFPRGIDSPDGMKPKQWGFSVALERAHGGLDALDAAVTAARDRFGDTALVLDHPVLGAFSVRDWCRFHLVHTRHHTRQIAERRGRSALRL
jgi:hypothetical protein